MMKAKENMKQKQNNVGKHHQSDVNWIHSVNFGQARATW